DVVEDHGDGGHQRENGDGREVETGDVAHIHAEEHGVEVADLLDDVGRDDVRADGSAVVDGLDQRGLHGGGVGGGQADGLTGGLDGGIRDAEDVVHGVVHHAQEAEQHQHGQDRKSVV